MQKESSGHLSHEERQTLYVMHDQGKTNAEIACVLGRHRSTIGKELERNEPPPGVKPGLSPVERAKWANDKARRRNSDSKRGRRGPLKLFAVRDKVEAHLREGTSPEKISLNLSQGDLGVQVSGKTIRRWLVSDVPELRKSLPEHGKPRRNRITPKKSKKKSGARKKRSVHLRPKKVNTRDEFGHYEADAIVCSQSTVAIISVIERKTRMPWFFKVPNLKADTVRAVLMQLFANFCPLTRKSCTFDNGGEFADWYQLEKLLGIIAYFCDPYCAWQKGAVEYENRQFRYFAPKGTNLADVSLEEVLRIQTILRARPMFCLDNLSPAQAWEIEMTKVRKMLLH